VAARKKAAVRGERSLGRRGPQFAQRRTFTIICEGQTEVAYFRDLVRHGVIAPDIHVSPRKAKHSDPRKFAQSLTDLPPRDERDEAWFVFDVEAPPRPNIEHTISAAEGAGFSVAWSNPCFEVWLIFHFKASSSPFSTSRNVETAVQQFLPHFRKGMAPSGAIHTRLDQALRNSKAADAGHRRDGRTPPMANPGSAMAALITRITELPDGR
jgi:RloB-like protein